MKKSEILGTLEDVGESITIKELSEKTDIPISSLRVDLYRLQEEGEVESVEEKGELKWKTKVSRPVEEKYDQKSKKYTP